MSRRWIAFGLLVLSACGPRCSRTGAAPDAADGAIIAADPSQAKDGSVRANDAGALVMEHDSGNDLGAALPGSADVLITLGSTEIRLRHVSVERSGEDGQLDVNITAAPRPCHAPPTVAPPYVSFTLTRGPGGHYYEGGTIGSGTFIHTGERALPELLEPQFGTVTVTRGPERGGAPAQLSGSVHVDAPDAGGTKASASGTFNATVCEPLEDAGVTYADLPATAPKSPLVMKYHGESIALARADMEIDDDDHHLGPLQLKFVTPAKLDGQVLEPQVDLSMTVTLAGATGSSQKRFFASPQPISVSLGGRGNWGKYTGRGLPRPAWQGQGEGWIRITRADLRVGGRVEGELVFGIDGFMRGQGGAGGGSFVAVLR